MLVASVMTGSWASMNSRNDSARWIRPVAGVQAVEGATRVEQRDPLLAREATDEAPDVLLAGRSRRPANDEAFRA